MDDNELVTSVAQAVGQALGEMSVGVGMVVLSLTNAVARQPGIDKQQLFEDMINNLPEVDGAAHNVVKVVQQAIRAALAELNQTS